jgi:hypothetical protein
MISRLKPATAAEILDTIDVQAIINEIMKKGNLC